MGLFDFLKPKKKPEPPLKIIPANRPDCDIEKTAIIAGLFKVLKEKRNDSWYQSLYENIATASFTGSNPQLLTGPDGFPYFILLSPAINQPFESFCIKNMAEDFLLERGWGVVFNPKEDKSADWVFTYGDIVNFHLNNELFSKTKPADTAHITFQKNVGSIKKQESVMIAQPSQDYLPNATRLALKMFLQTKGIKRPKIMMLSSIIDGKLVRKLAFNIHPEDYPVVGKLDHLMQQVGWFLPNNYILIPLPKNSSLKTGLNNL